mmetsp:Transcript_58163/g.136008  ORF Transcript_58163/g.136008 Transcript_58163/m.136008 type:complete len:222 (+) Transcript_58163:50-715(+)
MARLGAAAVCVALCLAVYGFQSAFVAPGSMPPTTATSITAAAMKPHSASEVPEVATSTVLSSLAPLLAGACLGLAAFISSPQPVSAGAIEDVPIIMDAKGTTSSLNKEQLGRGKRLFNAACSTCHVGGGTRTNQNVGLDLESLQGARPRRDNVEGLVDYLNNPTTYDGLVDISEVHPSMKAAKVWPKMRFMKQQDLVDISSYIMYETQVITEKWGGGKIYY